MNMVVLGGFRLIMINAARRGKIECLRYAYELCHTWYAEVSNIVAEKGHLECLRYVHEHGCPWDKVTTARAAKYGNIECLRYIREQNGPWLNSICVVLFDSCLVDTQNEHGALGVLRTSCTSCQNWRNPVTETLPALREALLELDVRPINVLTALIASYACER